MKSDERLTDGHWMEEETVLNKALGFNLQTIRKQKQFTQRELIFAANLKTTQQIYSKYETGSVRISAITLFRLANAMNIDINEFFDIDRNVLKRLLSQKLVMAGIVEEFIAKIRSVEKVCLNEFDEHFNNH